MYSAFVNRDSERRFLEEQYASPEAAFVVIYGRRRVGKTRLIQEFIRDKSALYFLASAEIERANIARFGSLAAELTGFPFFQGLQFDNWDQVFRLLLPGIKDDRRMVVIIDEFQYLVRINPAFPSILQRLWDEWLGQTNVMLIICGSLVSMMESNVLAHSSPLYGRRTGQIKLKQLEFIHYQEFFKNKPIDERNHHKDIALRSLSVTFKDEILEFYDLKLARIVDVIQTKVPTIEVKDRDMDINFILADNTIAHLEFESSEPTLDDQIRYGHYDLELYKQRRQKIHRIVIYGAGIKQAPKPLDIGSIRQTQSVIYLEKDFDGDQVFLELKDRILRGEPLRNLDKMKIILLPMMSSKISSRSRRALEMTEVLENYPEKDMGYYLIGAMVGTNYSLLQEPEKSKILEVLRMAQPFQELYREFEEKGMRKGMEQGMRKGIEKGRTEGKQESICKLLAKKFGPESTELQERVRKITDENALDRFIEELIVADNINDAAKVIEALN